MRLTGCILTNGDLAALGRALPTLRFAGPDEIVLVCDDPPTDALRAFAGGAGARLVGVPWTHDFAAARNAGLDAARGEWVFWLDADEELVAPRSPDAWAGLLARADVLGYYVTIRDVDAGGAAIHSPREHRRLYRRRPDVRYTGRVHEHFNPSLESLAAREGLSLCRSSVVLGHVGYDPAARPAKLRRNVDLLERELRDRPAQLYYLIELGRSLLLLGDPRGHVEMSRAADELARGAGHDGRAPFPLAAALLEYVIAAPADDAPAALSAKDALTLAARWFPDSPPLLWRAAQWHYARGEFEPAATLLERVLVLGTERNFDDSPGFDPRIFGDETRLNLGVCHARLGRLDRAAAAFTSVPAESRFAAAAVRNLALIRGGAPSAKF